MMNRFNISVIEILLGGIFMTTQLGRKIKSPVEEEESIINFLKPLINRQYKNKAKFLRARLIKQAWITWISVSYHIGHMECEVLSFIKLFHQLKEALVHVIFPTNQYNWMTHNTIAMKDFLHCIYNSQD